MSIVRKEETGVCCPSCGASIKLAPGDKSWAFRGECSECGQVIEVPKYVANDRLRENWNKRVREE